MELTSRKPFTGSQSCWLSQTGYYPMDCCSLECVCVHVRCVCMCLMHACVHAFMDQHSLFIEPYYLVHCYRYSLGCVVFGCCPGELLCTNGYHYITALPYSFLANLFKGYPFHKNSTLKTQLSGRGIWSWLNSNNNQSHPFSTSKLSLSPSLLKVIFLSHFPFYHSAPCWDDGKAFGLLHPGYKVSTPTPSIMTNSCTICGRSYRSHRVL